MSTPPTPPPPELLPSQPTRINLAKLAFAFAITIVLAFGLCTVTLMSSNSAMAGAVMPTSIVIEVICMVGLIVVGIAAIVRRTQGK